MRIFKTKWFIRFARKEDLTDASLHEAVNRVERGLFDAELVGGLIKQWVARSGEGRSGGFRTIIAYRKAEMAFIIYGFAKSELDNVDASDILLLRKAAKSYLEVSETELRALIQDGELLEIVVNDLESVRRVRRDCRVF